MTNRQNLLVTISVKEPNTEAKYSFEYWTDAPDASMFDQLSTWLEDLSAAFFWLLMALLLCLCCLFGGCIYLCAKKCCCKQKVNPEKEDTEAAVGAQNSSQLSGQEMVLEDYNYDNEYTKDKSEIEMQDENF